MITFLYGAYLRRIQFAFDPGPIRHRKRHCYGTDSRSTAVLRDCHLVCRYFEWQPKITNEKTID